MSCIAPADVAARVAAVESALPFSVNRLARAAANEALRSDGDAGDRRARLPATRAHLCRLLDRLGVVHPPSSTNFVLVRLPEDAGEDVAAELAREHEILVRDTAPFGFPGHLRVSLGSRDDMDRFGRSLAGLLERRREGTARRIEGR